MRISDWSSDVCSSDLLGLGFAMVLLWSLVILFLALGRMARMEATVSQVTGIEWQRMLRVSEIESQAQAVTANDMRRLLSTDGGHRQTLDSAIADQRKTIDTVIAELEELYFRTRGKAILGRIKKSRDDFMSAGQKTGQLAGEGDRQSTRLNSRH